MKLFGSKTVIGFIFLLFALILGEFVLFPDIFLHGEVQVPGDILARYQPWKDVLPEEYHQPNNTLLSDHIQFFYVWHHIAAESLQELHKFPLWNPHFVSGQPLFANAQPSILYPPNLTLLFLTPGQTATVRALTNILVAGVLTFLYCRSLKISVQGSILGGLAFAFSSPIMVGPGYTFVNSIIWLPMILLAVEKIPDSVRNKRRWAVVFSFGIYLSIIGGHPETTFHNFAFVGLYVLSRLFYKNFRKNLNTVGIIAIALMGGVLLAAIQLIPLAELMTLSATTSRSTLGSNLFYYQGWEANLGVLLTLFFPNFYGDPSLGTYAWPFNSFQNYVEQAIYFGLIPLMLAVGSIVQSIIQLIKGRNPKVPVALLLSLLGFFTLFVSLRFPLFESVNHLPLFSMVNNTRFKWWFTFSGAILAGAGLDTLSHLHLSVKRKNDLGRGALVGMVGVVTVATIILAAILTTRFVLLPRGLVEGTNYTNHLVYTIFSMQQPKNLVVIAAIALGSLSLFAYRNGWLPVTALNFLLIAMTFAELITAGRGFNTTMPQEHVFPKPALLEAFQNETEPFRVLGMEETFWPNYGAVYGLDNVGGADIPLYSHVTELYKAQGGKSRVFRWQPDFPLTNWLNVKYVVGSENLIETLDLNPSQFETVWQDGTTAVYQNRLVQPRAMIVTDAIIEPNPEQRILLLTSGEFDFSKSVVLSEPPSDEVLDALNSTSNQQNASEITFMHRSTDAMTLQVSSSSSGVLVLSEVFAPGWKATIDDVPSEVLTANHAFRALYMPEGTHEVKLFYQPLSFQIGFAVSIASLSIAILCLLYPNRRRYAGSRNKNGETSNAG